MIQLALGQRARLLDAVLRALVGQRQIRAAQPKAEPRKELSEAARRRVAPAVFGEVRARDVVIERALGTADSQAILLEAEASPTGLGHDLADLRPASRHDVQHAAERVSAEDGAGTPDQLDALDVVQR